jgi:hypothetical protein
MELSAEDIDATERLAGRPTTTDTHRELLLKGLPKCVTGMSTTGDTAGRESIPRDGIPAPLPAEPPRR